MSELNTIEKYLTEKLGSDSELLSLLPGGVHSALAKGVYPCAVFSNMSAKDITAGGIWRIASSAVYLVRIVGEGASFAAIDPAATRLDEILHGLNETLEDGTNITCLRDGPWESADTDSGVTYCSRGGLYRFMIR